MRHSLTVPTWAPWWTAAVKADCVKKHVLMTLACEGCPLPAHEYSEWSSPTWSRWWPPAISHLFDEARREDQAIREDFRHRYLTYPRIHPDHLAKSPAFVSDSEMLNRHLGILLSGDFYLCTCIQEGVTATEAASAATLLADCAAAATTATVEYTQSLMTDGYYPRNLLLPPLPAILPLNPVWAAPGAGWGNIGGGGRWANVGTTWGWGNGGGWGNRGGWDATRRHGRRMPRPRGYRRMGVIFLQPR
ncbi:hypothetical protein B0H10DRAFT_2079970 [Mycena sp. CBHHK59/15]|nr:hypothetical protein B0H10DRAFT_2079970 [Mycena sp. CBHHK59/15]